MSAITTRKSRTINWLEGVTLLAGLQALPSFTAVALVLKLDGKIDMANQPGSAAIFVLAASILSALVTVWLAPKFPRILKSSYELIYFDPTLSFSEKILRWRTDPAGSRRLLADVLMLSLLALAVASVR